MSLDAINDRLKTITGRSGTIAENLTSLVGDIRDSYTAVTEKGGTIPEQANTGNLPEAIASFIEES